MVASGDESAVGGNVGVPSDAKSFNGKWYCVYLEPDHPIESPASAPMIDPHAFCYPFHPMIDRLEELKQTAANARRVPVHFVETVHVTESFQGHVIWDGKVSIFSSPKGDVYAWAADGKTASGFVALPHGYSIDSPLAAVREWLSCTL